MRGVFKKSIKPSLHPLLKADLAALTPDSKFIIYGRERISDSLKKFQNFTYCLKKLAHLYGS
jgi:hypothetical protein